MANHICKCLTLWGTTLGLMTACANTSTEPPLQIQDLSATKAEPSATTMENPDLAKAPYYFNASNNVAIEGIDPVAYFTLGTPTLGLPEFTTEWGGVSWQFARENHLALFTENPQKYAPQYGGFCAWAVSEGYTAPIDPEAWKIVDGKLYLNFDRRVQKRWERDQAQHITQGDQNWPDIVTANN